MRMLRILVVEDSEPWRRFISSIVAGDPQLRIISEVSDGLEAVRKAEELKPDIILLDIGLPKLSGIEAARQISSLVPKSKILFLSQEFCSDVVQEALRFGRGFVSKADAGRELLSAVEAINLDKPFLSSSLAHHIVRHKQRSMISANAYVGQRQNEYSGVVAADRDLSS
jgi:DNA-binding NarL/FixJ family response regulator